MSRRLGEVPLLAAASAPLATLPERVITREPVTPQPAVDWHLVVDLRRRATEEIARLSAEQETERRRRLTADERHDLGRTVIRQTVRRHAESLQANGQPLWTLALEHDYASALESAIFGFGRLQPLLEIPDAENIEINGYDRVYVQYADGRRVRQTPVADSDEELVEAVRFLGESARPSRPFDDAHPTMTLALGDRFRLHAVGFGLSHRPSIVIRQHTLTHVTLTDLARTGMFSGPLAGLLRAAVQARTSIVISGDQGAGKTTLLRALIDAIPYTERFGTLETDYELLTHLQPGREHVVAMQARIGMGERVDGRPLGEVNVADLMPEALRQNLARLVVGEVRGTEAGAMFEAMQAGAGTLSTTHSHSAASTMDRLAARVAQGGVLTTAEAYRQIALHIGLLVHVQLVDDTWRGGKRHRYISEVRHVTGALEGDRPVTHLVYSCDGRESTFTPSAELYSQLAPFAEGAW